MSKTNTPTSHRTTCPLDCPDACSLDVTVADGILHSVSGAKSDVITNGYICGKVRRYADHVYCDERLLRPAKRVGRKGAGEFDSISWDEAYDRIAHQLQDCSDRYGGESVLPVCYGGSNGRLTQHAVDMRFFYRLGASHLDRTVCAAPSTAAFKATYGKMPGVAFPDYSDSKMIVVWGNNPHASGIHLVPHIQQAKKQGAKLVVIDPRKTQLAAIADLHLPLQPGTDLVVALSMIHWLVENGHADKQFLADQTAGFAQLADRASVWPVAKAAEVANLSPESLETMFRWYAENNPAVIRCGWGPERNRNGGSAVAAILAIPAVANKFCRSGGFTMSNSGAWNLAAADVIQEAPPNTRHINMNLVGEQLLNPQGTALKALFVYNCNPVSTLPEQNKVRRGLERDDLFTVVFDQVMTDTAQYADVILPATTFLEHSDLRNGYGHPRMGKVVPVLPRSGEAKPNYEVFAELTRRMGFEKESDATSVAELQAAVVGDLNDQMDTEGQLLPSSGLRPIQMVDVLPLTASGKIELYPSELEEESTAGLYVYLPENKAPEFPLTLISPATGKTVNSTFGQLLTKPATVRMHPDDASHRQLSTGQDVRVYNQRGEVRLDVEVDDRVRPGVVEIPKGIWSRSTKNGQTSNALSPDTLSDIGAGACFNDARVEIVAISG